MGLQTSYYANSLRNLIMKICAYLPQISNFGYNAQSVSVILLEHSDFYPSVFTQFIYLSKCCKIFEKKTFFGYTLARGSYPYVPVTATCFISNEDLLLTSNQDYKKAMCSREISSALNPHGLIADLSSGLAKHAVVELVTAVMFCKN